MSSVSKPSSFDLYALQESLIAEMAVLDNYLILIRQVRHGLTDPFCGWQERLDRLNALTYTPAPSFSQALHLELDQLVRTFRQQLEAVQAFDLSFIAIVNQIGESIQRLTIDPSEIDQWDLLLQRLNAAYLSFVANSE